MFKFIYKTITNPILGPVVVASISPCLLVMFYLPSLSLQNQKNKIVLESTSLIDSLKTFRSYYTEVVVKKIEEKTLQILNDVKFEFIKSDELFQKINYPMADDVISLMILDKILIKFNDILTTMKLYEEAKQILTEFLDNNKRISAAQYRDLLNTNRKMAITLLEHFDMIKLTKRVENDRIFY